MNEILTFKVDKFEGPLDLLLHLIKKNEMDIYDISMSTITEQYLEYLHTMKKVKLDVAGEYMLIAAMLLNIKSKQLLPNSNETLEDNTDDPRDELVQQLLLHQTFQNAALQLKDYATKRKQNIGREQLVPKEGIVLGKLKKGVPIEKLKIEFEKILQKIALKKPVVKKVVLEHFTIKEQIKKIEDKLNLNDKELQFQEIFPKDVSIEEVVTTFLAVLELIKRGSILAFQKNSKETISISKVGD